jgi:ADP-ribosylglycohydrolase
VYAWYRHYESCEETVRSIINCGGDTDTTAAIAGTLAGATVGGQGIPRDWLDGLVA